jgi:hypothetical protein
MVKEIDDALYSRIGKPTEDGDSNPSQTATVFGCFVPPISMQYNFRHGIV